jgi:hypothetical protein
MLSPKSYGQPSTSAQLSPQPITLFGGRFIKASTQAREVDDKDILNWLYKEEMESQASTSTVQTKKCGKGAKILENMGYEGKVLVGKRKEGIVEPIQAIFTNPKDKIGRILRGVTIGNL